MKKSILMLLVISMFTSACGQRETVVVQQAPAPQQIVYQDRHVSAGDAALVAGSVVAGAVLANYLVNGQPRPGYVIMNGNVYRDTPEVRNVYKRTTVINKTVVINNAPPANTAAVGNTNKQPVAQPVPAAPAKVKNPGDAAAEAEKAKMQAEQAEKARQAQLKADLQAKQAARAQAKASAPASKPSGGFNSMSKSASSMSSKRK